MDFKVLAVGDVVGGPGMDRIRRSLRYLKRKTNADFVIVNGENASVVGMTPEQAETILDAGADVITMGNHTFGKREIVENMVYRMNCTCKKIKMIFTQYLCHHVIGIRCIAYFQTELYLDRQ